MIGFVRSFLYQYKAKRDDSFVDPGKKGRIYTIVGAQSVVIDVFNVV